MDSSFEKFDFSGYVKSRELKHKYLGQTLKFLAPVRIGDAITASVEVTAVREEKRIITLRTDCTNQHGTLVLTGEAVMKC